MKCSMMFKRLLICSLLLCLVAAIPNFAGAQEQEPFLPDGSGDVLLLHGRNLSEEGETQLERIVTMASAMNKVMDFGTPEECLGVLGEYDYVIVYDLPEMEASLAFSLLDFPGETMLLGSGTLERYLTLTGQVDLIGQQEQQVHGKLTYTFPTGGSYECIVNWDALFHIQSDGYENGTIQAGGNDYPFCAQVGQVRYTPMTDFSQTLARAALMQEITQWMWPYLDRPTDYAQFLVLDSVYPFMPADQLLEIIDRVEELGVPYVISVMPLSENNEYPAMTQFCQVLAYAQSRGATVILHAPIIHKTVETSQELYDKLTDMTMAYIENGVYPVGIQVPASWTNSEPYLTVLGRYRTVFVYEDDNATGFDADAHTSLISRQGHQLVYPRIDLDQEGISQLQCYASATYVDCGEDGELFLRYAQAGKTGENPFMDLREYNHQVWLNECSLTYRNKTFYINDVMMDATFHPTEFDTDFDYQRSALARISIDLENQNRFLLGVVLVMTVAFLTAIAYARRQMRKRFLSGNNSEEE